jgi:hypothetical protein
VTQPATQLPRLLCRLNTCACCCCYCHYPQARHRGGPCLSCSDVCVECLRGLLQGLVSSQDLSGLRDELLAALEAAEGSQDVLMDAPNCYYVSKTWVGGFKRRTGGTKSTLEPPTAGEAWAGACCVHAMCVLPGMCFLGCAFGLCLQSIG